MEISLFKSFFMSKTILSGISNVDNSLMPIIIEFSFFILSVDKVL